MKDADACVSWLAPFALTIKEVTGSDGKCTTNSLSSCSYNIQTHSVNLELLVSGEGKSSRSF